MTFTPPTKTNPPFTTPPTWPFPGTSERWEADYRLRLLEAAVIFLWFSGGTGPPGPQGPAGPTGPAGPATAGMYSAVGTASPPTNGSTITPPGGFLWVDTGSTLSLPPYTPPFTPPPTGFNSVLDPAGEAWVSKNGSTWQKARDGLHAQYHRIAALTTPTTGTAIPFDVMDNDPYGLYNNTTAIFTIPLNGVYCIQLRWMANMTSGQWLWTGLTLAGTSISQNYVHASASIQAGCPLFCVRKFNAGDQITNLLNAVAALGVPVGNPGNSIMSIDYLGTG